ncbi:probable fbd-associated F-box protein at1g32375 [Phtheirospermum japonicum]|uniref:Probable fbd-associated F-box protein at1g32375 n=1 Tax=Phtheirospermum japonicum TaxID=374723 RepID=A0A830AYP0_9LAMI|nr:probable fbd-associated F-box protein at1g32375 [Phtheirospermum japonicum]
MSSNKRLKETQIDRLSELPDHLIIQIFSLLEVKQSAITSVLSKRWRYFWRESPRLIFREESSRSKKVGDFVNGVNRALLAVCGRMGLETLEFEFLDNYNSYNLDVDVWVRFAVKNRVKQVSLLLDSLIHTPCTRCHR